MTKTLTEPTLQLMINPILLLEKVGIWLLVVVFRLTFDAQSHKNLNSYQQTDQS